MHMAFPLLNRALRQPRRLIERALAEPTRFGQEAREAGETYLRQERRLMLRLLALLALVGALVLAVLALMAVLGLPQARVGIDTAWLAWLPWLPVPALLGAVAAGWAARGLDRQSLPLPVPPDFEDTTPLAHPPTQDNSAWLVRPPQSGT